MKIVDCFPFYNEIDILTYRLNLLYNTVDYFIIVESTHTYVGNEKRLYFDEIKDSFGEMNNKIIHVIVDDFPCKAPDIRLSPDMSGEQWINEGFQRNCTPRGLEKIPDLQGEDIIIVSDADEIPDPRMLSNIKNGIISVTINRMEMDLYYYNLNTTFIHKWSKGYLGRYEHISNSLNSGNTLSILRETAFESIKRGGWHLSYFGDVKFIQNKLQQFGHVEYSGEEYTNENHITNHIRNGQSIFNRIDDNMMKLPFQDNPNPPLLCLIYLPKYILY